jgi:NitT/TauT family transport system substrate-binding protein
MVCRKPSIPALVLTASLALLSAGCGGGSSEVNVTALVKVGHLEKTTLNVAVLPAIDSAGFFVALHEGLFAQEGLTVNYTPAFGSEVLAGQVKGQYDITGNNYVSYVEAQINHQGDFRIIAEGSLLQPGDQVILTMPGSPVKSLAQLRGHVLGVNADANVGYLLVASVLTENGITMSTKFSRNSVLFPRTDIPFTQLGQSLVSGQVAAAIVPEPLASQMEEQYGAVTLTDLSLGATQQFPVAGYAVTRAWAKANPNTLKAFLTALQAGQLIAGTNRAAAEAAFEWLKPGEGHVDKLIASIMALNIYPLSIVASRLQRVVTVMQQVNLLTRQFSIQIMLD